tara:strand:+ start:230 stop:763 length:534 start_codon:yes stop_codon:yes gene_type:complete
MASELHVDAIKHSGGTSALTIDSSGNLTTSANFHSAGSIVQLVTNQHTTTVTVGGSTYVDSGLTCQITPKFSSSKIFILVSQHILLSHPTTDSGGGWKIFRDSTEVKASAVNYAMYVYTSNSDEINIRGWQNWNYLDSPSTTSQITYKTQLSKYGGGTFQAQNANNPSTMTLMEIAQ